jgi:hypothetical protein
MASLTVLVPVGPGARTWFGETLNSLATEFPSPAADVVFVFDGCEPSQDEEEQARALGGRIIRVGKQGTLGEVLNVGLQATDAPFVARLDSDDLWIKGRIDQQLNAISTDRRVLVGGQAVTIDENGLEVGTLASGPRGDPVPWLLVRNQFLHPTVVFDRRAALDVGGYPALSRVEDYCLWLSLSKRGKAVNVNDVWAFYRLHDHQVSRQVIQAVGRREVARRRTALCRELGLPVAVAYAAHGAWSAANSSLLANLPRPWTRFAV